jgi:hypothetical protein
VRTSERNKAVVYDIAQAWATDGGDNLDADQWEHRDWTKNQSVREMLVRLAAEACLLL